MKKMLLAIVMACAVLTSAPSVRAADLSMILAMMSTEPAVIAFEEIAEEYMDENSDVEIEIIPLGAEMEAVLKTRMAANDLPDLWSTHGWSYMRYREYLEPLQNQPWVKDVNPLITPAIVGKQGDFYVLPMDVEISGIAYNEDVLAESGVRVDDIKTWADLGAACEKIMAKGFTPISVGGKDIHPFGYFFLWGGQSFLVADPAAKEDLDKLLAGTFPRERWRNVINVLVNLKDKGYLNKDAITASQTDTIMELARGRTAFVMQASNSVVVEALTYNPDAKLGFIPIPAANDDAHMSLMTGERAAIGVWKDSPNKEEALKFLNYLSQPDNIYKVATAGGNPAGLTTVTSDTGALKSYYAKYANTTTYPVFDRAFLPSGMWDTLGTVGIAVMSGSMTLDQAVEKTEAEFNRLYQQQ